MTDQTKEGPAVELLTYAMSPFGMKVYWALVFKGVPFSITYVNPVNRNQIEFTGQRFVPVLKVGDDWLADSGPICQWLEELFPDPGFAGTTDAERQAVLDADEWVTDNVIGLNFRQLLDPEKPFAAYLNARKLARIMYQTSGGIPRIAEFFWLFGLRSQGFVQGGAAADQSKTTAEVRQGIIAGLEERLSGTGYIAGTAGLSYADLSAFAQLAAAVDIDREGTIRPDASPIIKDWFERVLKALPKNPDPVLIPGRAPITVQYKG